MQLAGKVYMVTGAGGALAEHVNRALAGAGAQLALLGRPGKVREAGADLPSGLVLEADLLDFGQTRSAVERTVAEYGRLDGVIHTAGGFEGGKVAQAGPEALRRMLDVNLVTLANVIAAALPRLLESDDAFLAAVSSAQAQRSAGPGSAAYTASKAALSAYLRSLDGELAGTSLKVGILYPMGTIDTPANRAAMPKADPANWISGDALAEALLYMATRPVEARVLELAIYPRRQ